MCLKLKESYWEKSKEFWKKGLLYKICIIFWGAAFVSFFPSLWFHFLFEFFSAYLNADLNNWLV